jgi:vesicle transport protein SEC22
MAHVTYVARSVDGLILVETWDDANKVTPQLKNQAKQMLKKLHSMPPRLSVEGVGEFIFHYITHDGVCYLALFDKGYPKNMAFSFLEDVHKLFQEDLKREFGTGSVDYRSHIETIEKPYYFIKFDRQITKKKTEYKDPTSSKALTRLNENLTEVSSIMRQNIDEILHRGDNLETMSDKARDLRDTSKQFKDTTRMLSFMTAMQKYGVPAVIGLVIILVIWFKVFARGSSSSRSEDDLTPPS